MKIDVELISEGTVIKPSTPTPNHLRHYKLSFLDQRALSVYIPLIYFYNIVDDPQKHSHHHQNISKQLKKSLSEVLTSYYQLAGRIKDNKFVDCNDEGVHFLEAQVNCKLSQINQDPQLPSELNKFLPNDHQHALLVIQVNFFECGSFAIGALMSHKIGDASSAITFFKNWAATCRGDGDNFSLEFVGAKLFPFQFLGTTVSRSDILNGKKNIVLRRLVFSANTIAALREKYNHSRHVDRTTGIDHPTRVEVVSSFLWCRFAASTQPESSCVLSHAVNFRKRMDQPLIDDSFGNYVGMAVSTISSEDVVNKFYDLVNKFRDAISKVNKDYVKKLQKGISELHDLENKDAVRFCFTSFCRFPVYEADFGWGSPIWVVSGAWSSSNLVVLIDTKSGDGIEAWVYLKEEDMAKFGADREILALVSSTSMI